MNDDRPDPDALLARVQAEEAREARGKLKIFFGMAPGVGKTYAMLEAGRKLAKEGADVVVGYVEPHVRPETQALVMGLDILPRREVDYRGAKLLDFDLDAALARHPQVVLVDELAHTNAPGLTHAKRWQDVEELLAAGIDVFTTLNVQHLESLNDVVAQITGTVQRETVPDSIFEAADEIELVDLAPDDLIERLREGKVYVPQLAERAIDNFFRKGNLIALRELALRRSAERVGAQMEEFLEANVAQRSPATERLLVCVGPSPHSARLVRAAKRMATSLRAPWIVLHVETPAARRTSADDQERLAETLQLAEELGAETATVAGTSFADEVLHYARSRNVSKIVIGKPQQPRWREWLRGSYVNELARKCGDIDLYVITGEETAAPSRRSAPAAIPAAVLWRYALAIFVVAVCTAIGFLAVPPMQLASLIMLYLVGVVVCSIWLGHGPSILASVLGVAIFDFCFVPPYYTFAVANTEYLFTFAVMLATGLVISNLTARVRFQAESARQRERRTAALYAVNRELVNATTVTDLVAAAQRHVPEAFGGDVCLGLPVDPTQPRSKIQLLASASAAEPFDEHNQAVAQWAYEHGQIAGFGTDTLPSANAVFVPLKTAQTCLGVLGLRPVERQRLPTREQLRMLSAWATQLALAVERVRATEEARRSLVQVEAERLRNALLSAVSHDLRTPLAAITGASSTLAEGREQLDAGTRQELAESIYDEAERLNRLVANLLDMTRLAAGALTVHKAWQPLEEVVGTVLQRLDRRMQGRTVVARLPADLPLVPIDELLIQQVLVNLLENALKFSPPDEPIDLTAAARGSDVVVEVADRGRGLMPGDEQRIFEQFYQSEKAGRRTGSGLGLTICRGIVELHGGRIWAENRPGGGAVFRFTIPASGSPPVVTAAEAVI
ncbi:MAG: sensor histidine kinase KdpD [Planctomycetia bacterium]|nr:sensor histidine kinase KdpD [Planctomycetia bacterium]